MFENQYIQQRLEKLKSLEKLGLNPYENQSERDTIISDFIAQFESLKDNENQRDENQIVTVSGRIKFMRLMGKALFYKIEDESGSLQVYMSQNDVGIDEFAYIKKNIEVGDIIELKGYPFFTKVGELSLHTSEFKLLTKAIAPLPEKFHGVQDIEIKYRQRYLDLIMNDDAKKVFHDRSKIVASIRSFLQNKDFLEVETPMLHPILGGANAKPFVTHHNALGLDRYLRIAPELYLKRLIVGGFEAIFEINRNFRNEGIDHTHNPEFTMLEFYWAYKTYKDLLPLTQELIQSAVKALNISPIVHFQGHDIDLSKDFKILSYDEALLTVGGIDAAVIEDKESIEHFLQTKGIEHRKDHNTYGSLKADLFDDFVEPKLIQPTFITEFPIEISPLARRNDANKNIADRFELFIGACEIANGFSELNDPVDQYQRFEAQVAAKAKGDEEACEMDEDYIKALSYGMPPTAGEGIGIDRLTMLLTGKESIKDVLLFPAMR